VDDSDALLVRDVGREEVVDLANPGAFVLEVADRIRRQNLNLPAGTFVDGGGESTLRARGDYQSQEELLATVVRENPNGTYVRLGEVARLEEGLEKARYVSRYNGQPALLVSVTKKTGRDLIRLVERLDGWLADYRPLLPESLCQFVLLVTVSTD